MTTDKMDIFRPDRSMTTKTMMKIFTWIITVTLLLASTANAQPTIQMTVVNTLVRVVEGSGYVNFYALQQDTRLSFDSKSFFTIRIGSKYYTNNDAPPPGASSLVFDTTFRISDTLVVRWQMDSCRITQIVEPRQTQLGMRAGVRYFAQNLSAAAKEVQSQFLLDVQIGAKDGLQMLDPLNGLYRVWRTHTQNMPSHIALAGALTKLDDGEILPMLTVEDSLFGIERPSMLMVAHWPTVERMQFIDPNMQLPNELVMDASLAMQWKPQTIVPGETREIGEFAYATPEYLYCAPTLTFVPSTITLPENTQSTVLTVPSYVLNTGTSTQPSASLSIGTGGALSFENGTTTMERAIPAIPAMSAHPFTSRIKYNGIGPTGSLSFGSSCLSEIAFEQAFEDVLAPRIISLRQSPQPDCLLRRDTIVVTDSTSKDIGIESIDIDAINFEYNFLTPQIYQSPLERIAISVKDTMFDATATITATDGHSNVTTYIASYCTTPDTRAPEVRVGLHKDGVWPVTVIDNRAWDRRIDTIRITDQTNTTFVLPSGYRSLDSLTFAVRTIDTTSNSSFCIQVWDLAGNASDLLCYQYEALLEVTPRVALAELQLWPNPATTHLNIMRSSGEMPAGVTIYNTRGDVVWQGILEATSQPIDVSQLPAGAYRLILNDDLERPTPFAIVR